MNLSAFLAFLGRRWLPIVAGALAGVIGAVIVTANTAEEYRATTRLFVSIPAAQGVQEALQGVQLSSQLLQSYSRIATSRAASDRIAEKLDGRVSAGEVRASLSASPQPDTLLIDISAVNSDPTTARDIANVAAEVLSELVDDLESARDGAIEARVIDPAVTPGNSFSPRPLANTLLGMVIGLGVGLAIALALEATDRALRTSAEAASAVGAPVLARVPRIGRLKREPLVATVGRDTPAAEAYRTLRTAVRFADSERPLRSILVTSPSGGEGKTTTASNLALAFAQTGEKVVLIDADLRQPGVAKTFRLAESRSGITSVLGGSKRLDEVLVDAHDHLEVVAAGPPVPNPSELVGSDAMVLLLKTLVERADIVIIDAPPVLPVTDAVVLGAIVDGVVIVVESGSTSEGAAEDARRALDAVGANVIGTVLNNVKGGSTYHNRTS